jgi:hypothetical protein
VDVMSVPSDLCTDQSLREYYVKFGSIVRIDIEPEVQIS